MDARELRALAEHYKRIEERPVPLDIPSLTFNFFQERCFQAHLRAGWVAETVQRLREIRRDAVFRLTKFQPRFPASRILP
jgi:hypothetical protein